MKLSEVIKAKGKFQQGPHFAIQLTNENLIIKFFDQTLFLKLDEDWEEVKTPRQWSEKELMLFKLLPSDMKWIATNSKGARFGYNQKPERFEIDVCGEKQTGFKSINMDYEDLSLFDFLTITFEESPIYIGDLKGE